MYFFFLLIWIIFNGRVTAEILLSGFVLSAVIYGFFCKFMGYSPENDLKILRNLPAGILYILLLIWEVVLANVQIIKLVLSPQIDISPKLIFFKTDLKSEFSKVVLANSITLTPGTITGNLSDDGTFLVHCLDADMAGGIADSTLTRLLRQGEGGK